MPEIRPFRAFFYDPSKVDVGSVVAPPYDVISPQQQEDLYNASPYNVVRLDLGREEDRYVSAERLLRQWENERILVQDDRPQIYLLVQNFRVEGKEYERAGFIALCKLEPFGSGSILPHERTLAKPKEDRLRLLEATHAHFSQIFGLYSDPEHTVDSLFERVRTSSLAVDVTFDGVRNRLWKIGETALIGKLQGLIRFQEILVADGHHRYETALEFRELMRKGNRKDAGKDLYDYVPMYFANAHNEGLLILPTHRLLYDLPEFNPSGFLAELGKYFKVTIEESLDTLVDNLKARKRLAFGLVLRAKYVLFWFDREFHSLVNDGMPDIVKGLDVTILHKLVFERMLGISPEAQERKLNLDYVQDLDEVVDAVQRGRAQAALLMNPTLIDQVRMVAEAGYTMPQKSTYFYPKLLSGLVVTSLDGD